MNTTLLNSLSSNREVFHKALAHRYFQPNPMLNAKAYSAHKLVEHNPNHQSIKFDIKYKVLNRDSIDLYSTSNPETNRYHIGNNDIDIFQIPITISI